MSWGQLAFAVLAGIALLSAYKVVASPLITHAALYLAMVLVAMAGMFVILGAEFLAAVQVLVYAGAVLAVIVFAIMLSEQRELGAPGARRGLWGELAEALRSPYWGPVPVVLAGLIAAVVLTAIGRVGVTAPAGAAPADNVRAIGVALFSRHLLPFEIASAVLLAAMIGALALARGEGGAE